MVRKIHQAAEFSPGSLTINNIIGLKTKLPIKSALKVDGNWNQKGPGVSSSVSP